MPACVPEALGTGSQKEAGRKGHAEARFQVSSLVHRPAVGKPVQKGDKSDEGPLTQMLIEPQLMTLMLLCGRDGCFLKAGVTLLPS